MRIIVLGVLLCTSLLNAETKVVPSVNPIQMPKSVESVTLMQAIQQAYETNSKLRAGVFKHFKDQEAVTQASAGFRPTVIAEASVGQEKSRTDRSQSMPGSHNSTHTYQKGHSDRKSVDLKVTQNLFRGFGDVSAVRAAQSGVDASYYGYVGVEQDVILAAVNAYASVIFREKSLQFTAENEKFLEKQLEAVTLARDVGEKTAVDVSHAKAALAEARAKLIQAKGNLANARANYQNVIGQLPGRLFYPEQRPPVPATKEAFLALVQQKNPHVLEAQHMARQARHGVDAQRAELMPSLDLQGSVGRHLGDGNRGFTNGNRTPDDHTRSNTGSIALTLTVPIYERGANWSRLRQANHEAVSARLQLQQAIKDAVEKAEETWENWVAAKESIEQRKAQVEFSKISRDGAFLGYDVGEVSYLDALDAQNRHLEAQQGLEEARLNEVVQYFTILAYAGGLTHKGIELDGKEYPIKEHFQKVKGQWIATDTAPGSDIEKVES